ncbi:MAG: hypothetical protein J6Y16_06165 [Treponema sp.]|nr:hypothetical protein [Treponema sp.]
MKKHFVSIFLALMAMTAFSQTKKTWTIMPEMIGEHSYEDAVNWRDEGDPDYKEEADLATIYEGLEPYLATELNQRLVDFVYRKKMDDADIIVKVTIRKSENGSKNVYVATLNEGKVPKTGPVTYMSEELDPRTVAKSLAEKLCPTPVPGTISLFRVDGEAHVFWSDAKTDVKNDTLEYMIVRSPVKGSLTDKKTAIDLARKEKEEWKTNSEGGRFTESIHLNEESSKQCYFSVVVRNSLGCYSVYPVKGGQRITISTNLEGTIIFQTADPRFEEIQYEVDISSDANANIMLSEGAWKAKIQYYEGFDSEYKEFEVFSDNASKVIIQFDDVSEDYIESKYKRGMELKEKRRIDEAIKTLAVAADNQTFPHAEAMYQLGCIYEDKKDMSKALEYYKKAEEHGNDSAKERLINWYQDIVDGYKSGGNYLDSLYELKRLLKGSGETKRINDINDKIKTYEDKDKSNKIKLAKSLADTKKDNPDYRDNLEEAYDIYYYELSDFKKADDVREKIEKYDKERADNEEKELKKKAKKLLRTSKNDPEYIDNLKEASQIYNYDLDDEKKSEKIDKKIEDYEKLRESQRHRTTISMMWGFPHDLWQYYFEPQASIDHQPNLVFNGVIEATFGVWPNFFIGFSGEFNELDDNDYYSSYDDSYFDWKRNSILGFVGFNHTILHHINLYALIGGGVAFSSYEDKDFSYKWANCQLRAGFGFDWWFVWDEYDDWAFFDKIGMTFEYDVDYYLGEPWERLEGCFKLGFTFFWDTKSTSGFIPSFNYGYWK